LDLIAAYRWVHDSMSVTCWLPAQIDASWSAVLCTLRAYTCYSHHCAAVVSPMRFFNHFNKSILSFYVA